MAINLYVNLIQFLNSPLMPVCRPTSWKTEWLSTYLKDINAMCPVSARYDSVICGPILLVKILIQNTSQEYSINFKMNADADGCQKFCGLNEACNWWSYEPEQSLCLLFTNCTESGQPDKVACPDCISGERL